MEQYYSIADLVKLLKISDSTVRRYIRAGKLESKKIGKQHRITERSVNKFIDGQNTIGGNEE
jgi:excisionase family DNA binding protein